MDDPLKNAISIIVQEAEPDRIIMFGSRARGNAKPSSDYDLLVLKRGVKKKRFFYDLFGSGQQRKIGL
jgi:predicted nucleotidyltransferase